MKTPPYNIKPDSARSALMRRVRQRGTKAETEVSAMLRGLGIGFRRNVRALPGSPDFANRSRKWALFVNGCFWHHHEGCFRATVPTRNCAFWTAKFSANRERDETKTRALRKMGFKVVVIWECEIVQPLVLRQRLMPLKFR